MISRDTRRTKIIWSFEAKVLTDTWVSRISEEDVDALRLVFNKETSDNIPKFIDAFRESRKAGEKAPSIIVDVAEGARGAIANLKEAKDLAYGDKVRFGVVGSGETFEVTTKNLSGFFKKDEQVFLGYGDVVLNTLSVSSTVVELEVEQGGTVYPETDVHVPSTRVPSQVHDFDDKALGEIFKRKVDFVVLPGVRTLESLRTFKAYFEKMCAGYRPWTILRVDCEEVYNELDTLMAEVDGVLISRREMALSFDPATIPMLTKEIIQRCNDQAKLAFTASEMLGSMRRNVTPTRAEVSDIANAVSDGTDAVVLSEEVTHGKYADKALQVTRRIIADAEQRTDETPNWIKLAPSISNEFDAIAYTAYRTAERVKAKAIVCITKAGNTALKLASFGLPVPVIAVTFDKDVLGKLALVKGVNGVALDIDPTIDDVLQTVSDRLVRDSWLKSGDKIIFVSITLSSVGREASNLFTVQTLS